MPTGWPPSAFFARWKGHARGDCDCNGDVDLGDFADQSECLAGPAVTASPDCDCFDLRADEHIDLADFARFQIAFRSE